MNICLKSALRERMMKSAQGSDAATVKQFDTVNIKTSACFLFFLVLLGLVLFVLSRTSLIESIESQSLDIRFKARRCPPPASKELAIITLDDSSFEKTGKSLFQLMPDILDVMSMLETGGAKVIAYDVFLEGSYGDRLDSKIREEFARHNIILISRLNEKGEIKLPYGPFLRATAYENGTGVENVGLANVSPDSDGIVRSQPLYYTSKNGINYPSFPVLIASRHHGCYPAARNGSLYINDKQVSSQNNRLIINYAGPPGTFETITLSEVLEKARKKDRSYFKSAFEGKTLLIGVTESKYKDLFVTPLSKDHSDSMSGIEVIANSVNTIIQEQYIIRPDWKVQVLITALVCLSMLVLAHFLKPFAWACSSAAIMALYAFSCFYLFDRCRVWMNLVLPCASFFLTCGTVAAYRYIAVRGKSSAPHSMVRETDASHTGSEVFISYSRKDTDKVVSLVKQLQASGVSVWMDKTGIDGARLWGQKIVEAIEECKVLLLMASSRSFDSDNVLKEVTLASECKKHILPLYLEPVKIPKTIKYQLVGIQHIELFTGADEENYNTVLRSLAGLGVMTGGSEDSANINQAVQDKSTPEKEETEEKFQ
jgi:CHASE2 domain-containing sensor protein